jgi:hypothetical protein
MPQAGMDGEHINQASKGQHAEHQPLRRGQQELTSCSPSLFPCPGQCPQAATVDEFQARQVDDDVRVAGHNTRERYRDACGVYYVKLPRNATTA